MILSVINPSSKPEEKRRIFQNYMIENELVNIEKLMQPSIQPIKERGNNLFIQEQK